MFISPAFAQTAADGAGSTMGMILPLLLMLPVFYFFLIRPQQQRAKQTKQMLEALRRGDRVVTNGGIIGTVAKVISDTEVAVDIADNVRVRVVRSMISQVLAKPEPAGKGKDGDKGKETPRAAEQEKEDSEVVKTS
ncbi:MAG TPA: preprotein translocase subunit YajC [Stellaceae bacterium]|nr:preprotein translocase subunit YajC [Stellaceae bacterium]